MSTLAANFPSLWQDGPLLQRASTVVNVQVHDQTLPLNITMASQIPAGMGGIWLTNTQYGIPHAPYSAVFNKTIQTPHGTAPNDIWPLRGGAGASTVLGRWQHEAALHGVVHGCSTKCRVKMQAPAVFPTTCTTQVLPLHVDVPLNLERIINSAVASPLDHVVFAVDVSLIVSGEREVINLVTAFATEESCHNGTLNLTICTLESGTGEYVRLHVAC